MFRTRSRGIKAAPLEPRAINALNVLGERNGVSPAEMAAFVKLNPGRLQKIAAGR
jgi:hypothetical protein